MRIIVLLSLLSFICVIDAAIYEAPDPTPTAEEVMILELINRMRADPVAERDILAPEGSHPQGVPGNVDIKMFRKEMGELTAKPPIVFNLLLLKAARRHSYYMIHNGLGHDEQEGKEGYSGKSPGDRTRAAGYPGGGAENAFRDARDPAYSHLGFVVDWGKGGPGGMQPGRGHRKNIMGNHREMGPSALPHSGRLSVTHNFGNRRSIPRFAGGVVYIDRNHNNFYDVGEGVGDVTIAASGVDKPVKSWKSGAYTLELSHQKDIVVSAQWNGMSFEQKYPAGSENIKFDWQIPPQAELDRADALIAAVKAIPADTKSKSDQKKLFKATLDLYITSQSLSLDEPRKVTIASLSSSVGEELEAAKKEVRDLFSSDPKDFKKALKKIVKPYKKTAAEAWFKEAEQYKNAKYYVDNFEKIKAEMKPEVLKNLETAQSQVSTREFSAAFAELIKAARSKS